MKASSFTLFTAAAMLTVGFTARASAQEIVNFDVGSLPQGNYEPGATSTAGQYGVAGGTTDDWNQIDNGNSVTPYGSNNALVPGTTSNDVDASGKPTSVTLTDGTGGNDFAIGGATDPLFNTFESSGGTDTLNNVAPGLYDVYLYGENGGNGPNRGATFTINGVTLAATNDGMTTSPLVGVNYVEFVNVAPVNGQIAFTIGYNPADLNGGGGTGGESDFNGVQLVSTPEPFTWAMLLGGVALLAFGWRARANRA